MKQQDHRPKEKDKRRFLLIAPLLVLPFVTMAFYFLGGGTDTKGLSGKEDIGLNASLPDANATEKEMQDKLSFYEQAQRDSLKRLQLAKQDPYYLSFDHAIGPEEDLGTLDGHLRTEGFQNKGYQDPNERKVYEKLARLNMAMENPDQDPWRSDVRHRSDQVPAALTDPGLREDIARLEKMMSSMQTGGDRDDPEMAHINSVLENVLDIQHPERVTERLRDRSAENLGQVFAVSAAAADLPITLLDNRSVRSYAEHYRQAPGKQENRFYGLAEGIDDTTADNGIAAVVHETQTLVSGATVKLRLLDDVYINGRLIPKDHFVYGTATLQGERLQVAIGTIRFENSLFPVKLNVHDMDGLAGIYIPGAIARDVAKQGSDQALQGVGFGTFNPSLGAQAASAGIELGRNLLSKKIKLIRVEVKAGYKVLLRDGKRKGN